MMADIIGDLVQSLFQILLNSNTSALRSSAGERGLQKNDSINFTSPVIDSVVSECNAGCEAGAIVVYSK